jgi:hypothetical protein
MQIDLEEMEEVRRYFESIDALALEVLSLQGLTI